MHDMSDDTLSAYLDDALTARRRAQVDAAILRNPQLAQRLAALREADALVREAFMAIDDEPMPAAVQALPDEQPAATARRRWRLPQAPLLRIPAAMLAAGVVVGLALSLLLPLPHLSGGIGGQRVAGQPSAQPLLQAPAALVAALSTTSSNALYVANGVKVVPLNTFRQADGRVCREYQARQGGAAVAGIACRDANAGWHNAIVMRLGGHAGQGYAPATAGDDSLMALRPQWQGAAVLTPQQEQALLQRWAETGG